MSRRDADLLLDGTPSGGGPGGSAGAGGAHAGLVELLAVAAAPPRPAELAGEEAAVAAFRRGFDARPARPAAVGPAGARPRRRVAVVALSVVVALVGGTAYAAGTSRLPDPVQQRLHEALSGIGVPPPSPDAPPPSAASPATSSDRAHLTLLCRAWQSTRTTPGAPHIGPDDQRTLAAAAGGPNRIADYCATLAPTPSATPSATAAPGRPGNPGNPDPGAPPATKPGTPPVTPPAAPPGNGNPGAPADPGNGNGNGQNRKGVGPGG
ncbi:hypothetical protein [Virgisporangium ochraceum]|uniref:hypothetical protein n=1 Tax=Virgisporangium ochraceum TaxID=65505 RepID=UPI0019423A52|nr:hypothetical protein [Virgisporangium ochraceum]